MKLYLFHGAVLFACGLGCSAGHDATEGSGSSTGSGQAGSVNLGPEVTTGGGSGTVILGPGMAGSNSSPVGKECAQKNFILSSKPADVILVLDRSKSMIEHTVPPAGATRWAAVVPALTNVIKETDAVLSWGLKLFPEGEGSACAASTITDAVPAPIMAGNAATVNGIIMATQALGNGTPTGDAILRATAYLKSRGTSTNQYILLATDGDPSCPDNDSAAEAHAISAITAAKAAGFPTYVIGVLDPVEDKSKFPILNAMAEAGGTALSDNPVAPKFFQAYSEAELTSALKTVTGRVVSCVFEFDGPPPDPTNIAVKVNGELLKQDTTRAEGWEYTSTEHLGLELFGNACQQVKDATENKVDIIFGCKGEPIK